MWNSIIWHASKPKKYWYEKNCQLVRVGHLFDIDILGTYLHACLWCIKRIFFDMIRTQRRTWWTFFLKGHHSIFSLPLSLNLQLVPMFLYNQFHTMRKVLCHKLSFIAFNRDINLSLDLINLLASNLQTSLEASQPFSCLIPRQCIKFLCHNFLQKQISSSLTMGVRLIQGS